MTALEDMLYSGLLSMVGNNPAYLGLLLLGGFAGLVFLLPVRGDVKVMILVPTAMIAAIAVDFLRLPLFLILMAIVAFALLKAINR